LFQDLALSVLALLHGAEAHSLLFLLLAVGGLGAPWSQDIVLLAAAAMTLEGGAPGTLQATGGLGPAAVMAVGVLGVLAGDALSLWFGRHYGARWIRRPWAAKFVPPERLPALEEGMRRYGALLAFVTRFLPGQRGTLYFVAGSLRLQWPVFLWADTAAALVQVPLFLYGVRALGWQWTALGDAFGHADDLLTLLLVIVAVAWWVRARRRPAAGS
jgi:membrane protein DedA with SNARE-associated domain